MLHYTTRNQISRLLDEPYAHYGPAQRLIEAAPEYYDLSAKLFNSGVLMHLKEYRESLPRWGFSWRWPFIHRIDRYPLDLILAALLEQEVQGGRLRDYVLGNMPYM